MTTLDTEELRKLRDHLGGVTTPKMNGDNLAILLCSEFDDPDQENDDTGWTPAAVEGMTEVLDAIHAHYASALEAAQAKVGRLEAELNTANENHRKQATLLADTGRERDEAQAKVGELEKALGKDNAAFLQSLVDECSQEKAKRKAAEQRADEARAELARAERNRDMWKGQCERQAATLTQMREALHQCIGNFKALGAENGWGAEAARSALTSSASLHTTGESDER